MPRLTPLPLFVIAGICCSLFAFRAHVGTVHTAQAAPAVPQSSTEIAVPEAVVTEPQPFVPTVPNLDAAAVALTPLPASAAPSDAGRMPAALVLSVAAGVDAPEKAARLFVATNAARRAARLPELARDSRLEEVARVRAEDLVRNGYFDHFAADGSSAFSELGARNITYRLAGENLARNTYPAEQTVEVAFAALMESPGHRANILEPRFGSVGVVALQAGRTWLYVTVFMSAD